MKSSFNILYITLGLILLSCSSPKVEISNPITEPETTSPAPDKKLILFFGNSLTAGYGIEAEDSFPGLVAARIDSLDLEYRVINGGLSGETTASGLSRLDWFLEEKPSVFVLELGGNDGLRGIDLSETKKNLKAIIQLVRSKYPETKILLAGMQIPPNMGQDYTMEFQKLYPQVAEEEDVELIPFLLEGVAGNPDLNLPDGIHPTEEGHLIVFENIWPFIEEMIER
ncbi:lysophospholipase L1-like esterase [Belliella baltica DSM 15883]|uniref:Lysophospholipase L1-like esterase n=1 Tax=Belliella baltica (strain DSM 15883 / CIP 108006 / LMG 21964 / BA134) TaxID=866536 RepID=I3Z5J1_BELBD|nr:arylesterase [Belliella baltica]AFL84509.1 lysophospholipase L1-like esterase [Belliella baltica DSM 15883]